MHRAEPPAVTAEINVTPLVDVVLVLLIIFMVVTPILQSGAAIELPVTEQPPEKPDDGRRIVITIELDGAVRVDGTEVAGDSFQQWMRAAARQRGDHDVVIEADARVRFAQVKKAMLVAKAAGFPGVALVAERRDSS